MLNITKQNNSIIVEGEGHVYYPFEGQLTFPLNSLIVVLDESDIITFRSSENYDVAFSARVAEITIGGEAVTKENVGEKFGALANGASGGTNYEAGEGIKIEDGVISLDEDNIKTINGESIIGQGDIVIEGGDPHFSVNEVPEGNVGIGIVDGESDIKVGDYIHENDLLKVTDVEQHLLRGALMDGDREAGGFYIDRSNYSLICEYYNENMEVITDLTHNYRDIRFIRFHNQNGFDLLVKEIRSIVKIGGGEKGVYVYDGTETPSKVATQKDLDNLPLKTINGESIKGDGDITISIGNKTYVVIIDEIRTDITVSIFNYTDNTWATGDTITGECVQYSTIGGKYTQSMAFNGYNGRANWHGDNYVTATINIRINGVWGTSFTITRPNKLQQTLVSGTNIKTINGESVLGSGNIDLGQIEMTATLEDGTEVAYTLYGVQN